MLLQTGKGYRMNIDQETEMSNPKGDEKLGWEMGSTNYPFHPNRSF